MLAEGTRTVMTACAQYEAARSVNRRKGPTERPAHRCAENINMDAIHTALGADKQQDCTNTATFRGFVQTGDFLTI